MKFLLPSPAMLQLMPADHIQNGKIPCFFPVSSTSTLQYTVFDTLQVVDCLKVESDVALLHQLI